MERVNFQIIEKKWQNKFASMKLENKDGKTDEKVITNMETIIIEICSYKKSLLQVMNFIDDITKKYLEITIL